MARIVDKFNSAALACGDPDLLVRELNPLKVAEFVRTQMPGVYKELIELGWDLNLEDTWLKTVFVNTVLKWYGKKVAVNVTSSYAEYVTAKNLICTKTWGNFRRYLGIDCQVNLLIDPNIFLSLVSLDDIYYAVEGKKYISMDLSYRDDTTDSVIDMIAPGWGWLDEQAEA
jgi:hypothetical protein